MGQRSQIYIKYKNNHDNAIRLIARYFQFNWGHYMVSRARQLVEVLNEYPVNIHGENTVVGYAEANFDARSYVSSHDMLAEDWTFTSEETYEDIFEHEDNNDGCLFIDATEEKKTKYAFIKSNYKENKDDEYEPLDAKQYMERYKNDSDNGSAKRNIKFLEQNGILLTKEELNSFFEDVAPYKKRMSRKQKEHTV